MRKLYAAVAVLAFAGGLAGQAAAESQAPKETKIVGEVIDAKCNKGKGHEECANQCVRDGGTVAIKTADATYTIVGDFTASKNSKLTQFVAKDVEATGVIGKDKDGKATITVSAIALKK